MTTNAHELGASVGAWNALVRRARMADRQKLAALVMSSYANADGTGIRCGVARLAVDLGTSYRTAQRYLAWLRQVGLVELVVPGNRRRRKSDIYRLIIGPDVLEHVEVLDPAAYDDVRDGVREARDGRTKPVDQASPMVSSDQPVDNPDWRTPRVSSDRSDSLADQASPRVSYELADQASPRVSPGTSVLAPPIGVPPPSNKDHLPTKFTSPTDGGDLRTDVTGPGVKTKIDKPASVIPITRRTDRAQAAIAEAAARRAQAVAEHQARQATANDTEVS